MIQQGDTFYHGRPLSHQRCVYCHTMLVAFTVEANPTCGSALCRHRAQDAADDAAYKRILDGQGDQ